MNTPAPSFEIFLVAPPGLEPSVAAEAAQHGFAPATPVPGGVTLHGDMQTLWRAHLLLRGPARILLRLGSFRAFHLAQLDKRARKFPWGDVLRPDLPVRVEVSTKRSKIYHAKAAAQRIEGAIAASVGAPIVAEAEAAAISLKVRIDDNLVTVSLDATGEPLHKRGHKQFTGKAPMRENLAAMLLRLCGYEGAEPVLDPMCGSGTFVIEAAEIAMGLAPGRSRSFAFEQLAGFDATAWAEMKGAVPAPHQPEAMFCGSDRDQGAAQGAAQNAARAGVDGCCRFTQGAVSDLTRPDGPPGLVMVNPPYGARIGNRKQLFAVYGALGQVLSQRFQGWRVGMVTSDGGLARASGLPFTGEVPQIAHGGLRIGLYRTGPLG